MKKRRKAPTLAKLKAKAWKLLSECIRREAADPVGWVTCYTCDAPAPSWKLIQAGHAIPGRTGAVLLDEEIIRPQCYRCNVALRGNYPVFVTKLIREKADQLGNGNVALSLAVDWWEGKLAASRQVRKWSRSELEEKCEEYKARLAAL